MIFDAHAHIYPDKLAARAVAALNGFYDFVCDGDGTYDDYTAACRKGGVEGFLLLGVATNAHQNRSVNAFVAESVRRAIAEGFHAYGFMGISQDIDDFESEVNVSCADGLCGVKIHPDIQGVDILDPRMLELYELLQARDLPICFHAGDHRPQFRNSEPPKIARVAQLFPHLRINAAHFGGYTVFDDVGTLFSCENVHVDLSSSLWLIDRERALGLISYFGTERVMFGTDCPVKRAEDELQRFEALGLSDADAERILGENFRSFVIGK